MFAGAAQTISVTEEIDDALDAVPAGAAVYAIWPASGNPYLGTTAALRRRLKRLLRERQEPSRLLNLRAVAQRVEYWSVASRLESSLVWYHLARSIFPDTYLDILKLRMPAYLKLGLSNRFPRIHVTSRMSSGPARYYGPFRTRAAAEAFEQQFLDLFQIRRCFEDLDPSPEHPGCIYGEMAMCLRPCQSAVGDAEYASEVARVTAFLTTDGRSTLHQATAARDLLSEEMQFEDAARQHKRVERIEEVIKLRDELVCDIDRLYGIAITACTQPDHVLLWFVAAGAWQAPVALATGAGDGSVSLDRRLKELAGSQVTIVPERRERQEHLAILSRWYHSSWRDGEWIGCEAFDRLPYRRLVNAISRIGRPRL